MSTTGLEVFDYTVQRTNEWLQEIMQELGTENRQQAYESLRATLHTLRDRLRADDAAHLGAQLPMLIRGIYYEGWRPSLQVNKMHRDEFLERVREYFTRTALAQADPEAIVRAVFRVLSVRVDSGEIAKIVHVLPQDLQELWPATRSASA